MDEKQIWDSLSNISVGTVVAWIIVICAIISVLCAATIKLYKIFTKYRNIKDDKEKMDTIVQEHDKVLNKIEHSLKAIEKSIDEQKDVTLKQLRHTLVHTCEDALERGEISINKLRSLEEMYAEYTDVFHANSYVSTLVKRTRDLKITGKLDE